MARKTNIQVIATPEKLSAINKSNLRLKDDFLMYLKSIKRSEGTIYNYNSDLSIVFTYILDNLDNKDFAKLTKRDFIAMQNWMVDRGLSSARIRRLKSAISSLSNYCENILEGDDPEFDGYRSSIRKIESPPLQPVREKTVLSDDDLQSLLDVLVSRKQYGKACLIALGMYSGRRKAELARFKMSDFDESKLVCDGALYKSDPILTKGNKYLECYTLAKKFKPYLDMWIEYRNQNGIISEWLFPDINNHNEHIKISTLNGWADSCSRIMNKNFYLHSLRHRFCTALVQEGVPDSVIVDIIGWSSSEMLKIYDDSPKDEKLSMFFSGGEISVPEKKSLADI